MASAASIFSKIPLNSSFPKEQWLSRFSQHLPQARQPWRFLPPTWTTSVSQPALARGARAASSICRVLPFFLGLPLRARTFMADLLNQT